MESGRHLAPWITVDLTFGAISPREFAVRLKKVKQELLDAVGCDWWSYSSPRMDVEQHIFLFTSKKDERLLAAVASKCEEAFTCKRWEVTAAPVVEWHRGPTSDGLGGQAYLPLFMFYNYRLAELNLDFLDSTAKAGITTSMIFSAAATILTYQSLGLEGSPIRKALVSYWKDFSAEKEILSESEGLWKEELLAFRSRMKPVESLFSELEMDWDGLERVLGTESIGLLRRLEKELEIAPKEIRSLASSVREAEYYFFCKRISHQIWLRSGVDNFVELMMIRWLSEV